MGKGRRLLTNFSKGELSPLIEGRPDLAAYFEGGSTITNWLLLRQGGLTRRFGTRYIAEVKTSAKDTVLLPFEFSVDTSYMLEVGDLYIRMFKAKAAVKTSAGGPAVEVVTPFVEADLRTLHFTQSADVMFLFHNTYAQRTLSRTSDTAWALAVAAYTPPPSFEKDTDISGGATLTPAATTGTSVVFTASAAVFLEADIGRQIKFGSSLATIKAFGASAADTASPNDHVRADILVDFPDTNPIATGLWKLHLSPQTTLDPDIKEPIGKVVNLTAGANAFRTADVGKFVHIWGGVVEITTRTSATAIVGLIRSVLGDAADANPAAAPSGAWTLEEASWSTANGFPRTGEFFQGRLGQASTTQQPTAFWLSASDDFFNYAVGTVADMAIDYTIASRQVNRIEWMADNTDLFIGTAGTEQRIDGDRNGEPLGGDVVPLIDRLTAHGSAPVQPVAAHRRTIFLDRSRKKIFSLAFDISEDGFDAVEHTADAEHITSTGIRLGQIAFQKRPDPRMYFVREDGKLVTFTFYPREKVVGFTVLNTDGLFESVGVIPGPATESDHVYVIVKRTINAVTKRYIEVFEPDASEFSTRNWTALQTDCATLYTAFTGTTLTGLSHLEAKTVNIIVNNSFIGTKTVTSGQVVMDESVTSALVEVGLDYVSTGITMRPAIAGVMIEGLPRSWDKLWLRLYKSIGGQVNGETVQYPASNSDTKTPYTGDIDVPTEGWDTDGRVTVIQNQPYPMTLLAVFGDLSVGDRS